MPKNRKIIKNTKNAKNRKTSIKKRSLKRYTRKYRNLYKGGGCPCQNDYQGGKMTGGYGSASFPLNYNNHIYSYAENPNVLPFPAIENNIPDIHTTGGKKNKTRKSKKNKQTIMHGGNILPQWATNDYFGNNYVQNTGDLQGVFSSVNLLNGTLSRSTSLTDGQLLHPDYRQIA
jgi:hypothetical protein